MKIIELLTVNEFMYAVQFVHLPEKETRNR